MPDVTLDQLCECAGRISIATGERQTDWRGECASLVFGKLCATCISFLRLNPNSSYFAHGVPPELWDLSSAGTLCRSLIEAFYVLVYLVESPTDEAERAFQKALWQYHRAFEGYEMMRVGIPDSAHLSEMQGKWESARAALQIQPKFQQFSTGYQKRILEGEKFMLPSKTELSRAHGISEDYFRFHYRRCSSFAHTSPYSISSLAPLIAGTEDAKRKFRIFEKAATGYIALAVEAFIRLCPDQQGALQSKSERRLPYGREFFKAGTNLTIQNDSEFFGTVSLQRDRFPCH